MAMPLRQTPLPRARGRSLYLCLCLAILFLCVSAFLLCMGACVNATSVLFLFRPSVPRALLAMVFSSLPVSSSPSLSCPNVPAIFAASDPGGGQVLPSPFRPHSCCPRPLSGSLPPSLMHRIIVACSREMAIPNFTRLPVPLSN